MKALTCGTEMVITEDWRKAIPSLGVYKPRHLLRRVGPLLVGVCLDRGSGGEKYKPVFHVHALCKEFPCISLTLAQQLRAERTGGPDYIEVRWHNEKHQEAAARMVRQAALPLEGDLSLGNIVAAYREYMVDSPGIRQRAILYQDMVLLAVSVRELAFAEELLCEASGLLGDDPAAYRHVDGKDAFMSRCQAATRDPSIVDAVVTKEIAKLGVEGLPESSLVVCPS